METNTPSTKPLALSAERQQTLQWLDGLSQFLDNRFRIPGTQFRFGADAIIGLVPYVGDVLSFLISGVLVFVMARRGASGMVVVKMVGNIFVDGAIGTIPLLGDIFDFRYRANMRNIRLLKAHYAEGKHEGSAWWVVFLLLGLLLSLVGLSLWVIWQVVYWIFS